MNTPHPGFASVLLLQFCAALIEGVFGAIFRRGHAILSGKELVEMRQAGQAYLGGDVCDASTGAAEQRCCLLQAVQVAVAGEADAKTAADCRGEVVLRLAKALRHLSQRNSGRVHLDIAGNARQLRIDAFGAAAHTAVEGAVRFGEKEQQQQLCRLIAVAARVKIAAKHHPSEDICLRIHAEVDQQVWHVRF